MAIGDVGFMQQSSIMGHCTSCIYAPSICIRCMPFGDRPTLENREML